jgi:hypothetical protein
VTETGWGRNVLNPGVAADARDFCVLSAAALKNTDDFGFVELTAFHFFHSFRGGRQ